MARKLSMTLTAIVTLALTAGLSPRTCAEEAMTRAQADEIISELRQMRVLLERLSSGLPADAAGRPAVDPATAERVKVGVGTAPALGPTDAPLAIVEFTDYQCPFCQQFHLTTFQELKRDYIDTGKVRYLSRDLPLAMHPNAMSAAHAARCADEQGKFWEMRNALIANANQLGPDRYATLADELKLDRPRFQDCLAEEKHKAQIATDMSDAAEASITGTPSFVIGRSTGDAVQGVLLVGALPYATFDARLKELLDMQ
jgi:protein-disulfide isomerase